MDNGPGEGPANRYALQVSGEQLQDYLKALKHVPESLYSNGAHIIADMDESSLPESLSASRYDSDQEGESSREQIDLRSLIPAIRLERQHHLLPEQDRVHEVEERPEPESRRRSLVFEPEEEPVRFERPLLKRPTTRELLRDLLMRREDIARADSPLGPVAAVAAQVMDDQISHVKEAINEAKALQATEALKGKVVEALKQKEADMNERKGAEVVKEFATSTTARMPDIENGKFKPEEERPDKYRAQESENKYKTQVENYKPQEVVIKESSLQHASLQDVAAGPTKEIGSSELFMSRVQDELSKSLHFDRPAVYAERENKSDTIDMKTVRELLGTLIREIENIQVAARTLSSVRQASDYSYEPKKSVKPHHEYQKEYSKQQYREERTERPKKRKPLPYEILTSYQPVDSPTTVTKKPKRYPKTERTVYLKPHEVMKLLEPEPYEPMEVPVRRNRPSYAVGASTASIRRMHAPFPMRRAMYPRFYPGIAARITCCDQKCATNFGFSSPAGFKK